MPVNAEPKPIAAATPSIHQAAMPAYERVMGSNPPLAYESQKTQSATPKPRTVSPTPRHRAAASRSVVFWLTLRYSNAVVCGSGKLCVAAFAVVGVFVVSPAAAVADSCQGGTSAVNIYSECYPTASGGTHHNRGANGQGTSGTTTTVTTVTVSKTVQTSIAHAGYDKKILTKLVTDASLGATQALPASAPYKVKTPSALGAVFDLGSGPTALFAMLAAAAIVLIGVGGFRGRRQRRL
jgi:hypothetical protein